VVVALYGRDVTDNLQACEPVQQLLHNRKPHLALLLLLIQK
jgi:hypothetical protein